VSAVPLLSGGYRCLTSFQSWIPSDSLGTNIDSVPIACNYRLVSCQWLPSYICLLAGVCPPGFVEISLGCIHFSAPMLPFDQGNSYCQEYSSLSSFYAASSYEDFTELRSELLNLGDYVRKYTIFSLSLIGILPYSVAIIGQELLLKLLNDAVTNCRYIGPFLYPLENLSKYSSFQRYPELGKISQSFARKIIDIY